MSSLWVDLSSDRTGERSEFQSAAELMNVNLLSLAKLDYIFTIYVIMNGEDG